MTMRLLVLALVLVTGCGRKELLCRMNNDCVGSGPTGICLLMHCAFEDPQCVSKYRWDDTAGVDSGDCVDIGVLPDARIPDARPDAPSDAGS